MKNKFLIMHSYLETWSQGDKTFFMLNTMVHKISTAHKNYNTGK